MFSRCIGCHNEYGLAVTPPTANRHVLRFPGDVDFAAHNVDVLRSLARQDVTPGLSLLLALPTGQVGHSGGVVIAPDSPEEQVLATFVERLRREDDVCGEGAVAPLEAALADLSLLSRRSTLARARLALASQPLSPADEALPLATDEELDAALVALLDTPAAANRVVAIYNDWLWTDRFTREVTRTTSGVNQLLVRLAAQFGPRRFYFQPEGTGGQQCDPATDVCCGEAGSPYPGSCVQPTAGNNAADSLAREPLELVRHVWSEGLPVDTLATGDFTMANPYTAILYGFNPQAPEWTFDDVNTAANDRAEFHPLRLRDTPANELVAQPGVGDRFPHAGLLTPHAVM
ncbi:MAG: DUF1592 domain-containing protein [Deltaproteobacteria bacterium]|nr:DUF1592 domain-containing protein [Deltaproteobacteria bacterium]